MIDEVGKDLKGNGLGLYEVLSWNFRGETEENH
jgi:hypothetical protein